MGGEVGRKKKKRWTQVEGIFSEDREYTIRRKKKITPTCISWASSPSMPRDGNHHPGSSTARPPPSQDEKNEQEKREREKKRKTKWKKEIYIYLMYKRETGKCLPFLLLLRLLLFQLCSVEQVGTFQVFFHPGTPLYSTVDARLRCYMRDIEISLASLLMLFSL